MNELPEYLKHYKEELNKKTLEELLELYKYTNKTESYEKAEIIRQVIQEREKVDSVHHENTQANKGFNPDTITATELLESIDGINNSKSSWKKNIIGFAFSLLLFAGIGLIEWKPLELLILFIVIIIHELGHFVGMKLFGYIDPKIFFIPGLGAATTARKSTGNATHEAIVSLLGPLPGILVGIALAFLYYKTENRIYYDFAELFLIINLFNLLPISPLDGGRFFETVLFRRNYIIELIFRIITGLILFWLVLTSQSPFLIIFPIFFILSLPEIYRISKAAKLLKSNANIGSTQLELIQSVELVLKKAFTLHQNKNQYVLRAKRLLECISESNMKVKTSILMVILYLLLFPFSFLATGSVVYLFKEPLNLSNLKNREKLATLNPSKNKVVNSFLSKQIEQMNTIPKIKSDTSTIIIERKSSDDIHVGLIAVADFDDAMTVKQSISNGSTFEDVARKYSKGPNAIKGGDIGYVNPKDLDKKIADKLIELKGNEISDVIKTGNGYMIVKRLE